jgi:hypothetical protein
LRSRLDRRGAVAGRAGVAADHGADVAGEADQVVGNDGPDAEQLGQACVCDAATAMPIRRWESLSWSSRRCTSDSSGGQVMAGSFDRRDWSDTLEETDGVGSE